MDAAGNDKNRRKDLAHLELRQGPPLARLDLRIENGLFALEGSACAPGAERGSPAIQYLWPARESIPAPFLIHRPAGRALEGALRAPRPAQAARRAAQQRERS